MIAVRFVLWIWLIAALVAGRMLLLQRLPPPAIQGILLGLTALLIYGYRAWPTLRAWADNVNLRVIVLLHVSRFVGFYFLVLYRRGELPYAFAVPGGIGDIIVAALAFLVVILPLAPATRLRAIAIWNVVGLIDIILVVLTAASLGLTEPSALRALTHLPLSLLPTFLVPLIIATHFLVFVRLRRPGSVNE
ncbi:MAG: hypothetical protein JWM32_779 [Verrucomicrobia bacterium]|nr:hypothetical protein [Verrucomicrobiota bacterium]